MLFRVCVSVWVNCCMLRGWRKRVITSRISIIFRTTMSLNVVCWVW